mgnify:FL=1
MELWYNNRAVKALNLTREVPVSNRIETGWLYDFYGPLLTERQQKLLSLYCNEDFSLSEIAAREGISRQGVYDAVHRAERQLEAYEKQLGLLARYRSMTQGLEESLNVLEGAEGEKARRAREILTRLLSQEEE